MRREGREAAVLELERQNYRALHRPPYPKTEQAALNAWSNEVSNLVCARLAEYEPRSSLSWILRECTWALKIVCKSVRGILATDNDILCHSEHNTPSTHRALAVTEFLDSILVIAGPGAQLSAWSVSRTWRRSTRAVMESRQDHLTVNQYSMASA